MNHMNYNWPNRGVPQYPYPPSAPTTNASSNSQTAFPYQQHQGTTPSYTAATNYTPPAGYSQVSNSYNSAAAPTYNNSTAYATSNHHHSSVNSYTPTATNTHPQYSPAVHQRQTNASAVDNQQSRPTVAPGTPLSTSNNSSSLSRNSSLNATNQQAHAHQTQQAQAQAQAQARQAQQAREQQRQQQEREAQQQAAAAQAQAEAAAQARADAAATEQARQRHQQQQQAREKQREQQAARERERELREQQQLREQLQESPKVKPQLQQPQQQQQTQQSQQQQASAASRSVEPVTQTASSNKPTPNPPHTQLPPGATPAPKRKSMGRLGDADVHAAFVEFRAKETDKCMSAQCIHCGSVRAKNTSRQRQHLLECQTYLNSMRETNPNHPILDMAAQHQAGTPLKDIVKPGATPTNGATNGAGYASTNGHVSTPTQPNKRIKTDHNTDGVVVQTGAIGNGWAGGSLAPTHTLPPPRLERDFQLAIQLNPRIDVGKNTFGSQTYWTSFISGHWNGRFGKGTVVPGGQDKQHVSNTSANGASAVHTETQFLLQTHDHPTAFITIKMEGWRTGSRDIMEQLMDPSRVDSVDPRTYTHRCFVTMETGDDRYADLNTGMWLGSVVRKATEVVYDAYRIS